MTAPSRKKSKVLEICASCILLFHADPCDIFPMVITDALLYFSVEWLWGNCFTSHWNAISFMQLSFFFLNLLYKVTVNMKAMYLGKLTARSVHRICGMLNKCWLPPLFPLLQFQLLLLLLFVFRSTLLAPFFSLFLNFTFLIWFFQFYL